MILKILVFNIFVLHKAHGDLDQWNRRQTDIRSRLDSLQFVHDYDICVKRTGPRHQRSRPSNVGIIAVVCSENLDVYNKVRCRGDQIAFHFYSKCGLKKEKILSLVPKIRQCSTVKTIKQSVYTELTWAKEHNEFLEHIIKHYHELEDTLIFTGAHMGRTHMRHVVDLNAAVDEALKGVWDYKPLWPTKLSVQFNQCPIPCNTRQFGRELCALYRRFTCEPDCRSCPLQNEWQDASRIMKENRPVAVDRCFYPNARSTFLVSASRVLELPASEYMWIREWLQSWQEDGTGTLRRLLAERMWPVVFGCPEDIHNNGTSGGCTRDMRFPSGSQELPPAEMVEDGLVHSPALHSAKHLEDRNLHTSMHTYPHLLSPKYGSFRRITFVVPFGTHSRVKSISELVKTSFASVILHHPSARFILIVKEDLLGNVKKELESHKPWFAKRLEIVAIKVKSMLYMGSAHHVMYLQDSLWVEAHFFELVTNFVVDHLSKADDPGLEYGHVVFMHLNTILMGSLWDAFHGEEFTFGLPVQPLERRPLDSRVLIIHRSRILQAADILRGAMGRLMSHPFDDSLIDFINRTLLSCVSDGSLATAAFDIHSKPSNMACNMSSSVSVWLTAMARAANPEYQGDPGQASVRLLPCGKWAALKRLPDEEGIPETEPDMTFEACGSNCPEAMIVRLDPPDGRAAWEIFMHLREMGDASAARTYLAAL